KRENQATRWMNAIIPKLIPIYMDLVQVTYNLCYLDTYSARPRVCTCTMWVYIDYLGSNIAANLAETMLTICPCSLAATELLVRGFFPCTPLEPTVVIKLRVLEFVMRLFHNLPPNNTTVTNALKAYVDSMGSKLDNRDALQHRFRNALEWYISMRHRVNAKINTTVLLSRSAL
ncbi:hypothetical protein K438DRAFT_1447976, partial [Mycena galopus ATCC 62051]